MAGMPVVIEHDDMTANAWRMIYECSTVADAHQAYLMRAARSASQRELETLALAYPNLVAVERERRAQSNA